MICAARLAVSHVNAGNASVVPGLNASVANLHSVIGSIYDSGYTESKALASYNELLADGGEAIVGAARSAVSMPLASLAKIDEVPQCSYWSSSPDLSNKLDYPYCASALLPYAFSLCA